MPSNSFVLNVCVKDLFPYLFILMLYMRLENDDGRDCLFDQKPVASAREP